MGFFLKITSAYEDSFLLYIFFSIVKIFLAYFFANTAKLVYFLQKKWNMRRKYGEKRTDILENVTFQILDTFRTLEGGGGQNQSTQVKFAPPPSNLISEYAP